MPSENSMPTPEPTPSTQGLRLLEAAAALLDASPSRSLSTTQLNKALFYFDLAHLRDFGETYTGATYIALKQGPVVAKYRTRLVGALEDSAIAHQGQVGKKKPIVLTDSGHRIADGVAPRSTALAQKVAKWSAGQTATAISDFSHRNVGWEHAYDEGIGGSPRPIDWSLALQQIVDEDPWLEREATSEENEAFAAIERGEVVEWV